jgi:hypothetical protein
LLCRSSFFEQGEKELLFNKAFSSPAFPAPLLPLPTITQSFLGAPLGSMTAKLFDVLLSVSFVNSYFQNLRAKKALFINL